ncbi:MAG TPA: DHA2 family efflux MFS transporter permease subunit [Candidatus Binatia bacterium]
MSTAGSIGGEAPAVPGDPAAPASSLPADAAPPAGAEGAHPAAYHSYAPHNPWLIALVATLATFMEVLDTSIANVALPHIAGSLGAGVEDSTWILTSYLVSNAIVLPISGWMATLFGRRNFYLTCVAMFTASSCLCGMAPNLGMLVFFRLLQGLGGGGLQPSTQAILIDTFPIEQRGMGMAMYGMTVVAAPVIGPTLGGWITDNSSWRWIFFINVPVGILSMLLSSRFISDPPFLPRRRRGERGRIDWMGLGALSLAIGAGQMMLDIGERRDWLESGFIQALAATCVIGFVFTVWWELRQKEPVVQLRLLKDRNFGFSVFIMLLFGFVLYGSTVLLPLFMQTLLGYTALLSGLAVSPGALVIMTLMPLVGWMISRFDPRWMICFGSVVISLSLQLMAGFNLDAGFWTITSARMVQGFGLAFLFVPVNTLAYAYVDPANRGAASSLISLARNIGASIGIALMSTLLTHQSQIHQNYLVANATPYNPAWNGWIQSMSGALGAQTSDRVEAVLRAEAMAAQVVSAQARALAFVDLFRLLSIAFLMILPVVLLMRKPPKIPLGPAQALAE